MTKAVPPIEEPREALVSIESVGLAIFKIDGVKYLFRRVF